MTSTLEIIQPSAGLDIGSTELTSLTSFIETFPLQGESLYSIVFKRNSDIVQTQKARFAVVNLEKILTATFAVSATSGFDRMSLRDLSRQTGMSMGSIYSCISKKEDIASMIADIVRLSSELTRQHAMQSDSIWSKIEQSIRFHLYASTLLQPWYFFLYFETRCLPQEQQRESKKIELDGIKSFEAQIQDGVDAGEFHTNDARMVANTIVVLLEDWYLKPWKTLSPWKANISIEQQEKQINNYSQSIIELVRKLLVDS
ncbi:MAG: TetR/AcrR family transcriptional regulator [Arenicella sp.]|nr:TetR/AcrR family transcriptional regulator [Arenicella sp.]